MKLTGKLLFAGGSTVECTYNDNDLLSKLKETHTSTGITKEINWDYERDGKTVLTYHPENRAVEVIFDLHFKLASILPLNGSTSQVKVTEGIWDDELVIMQADQV